MYCDQLVKSDKILLISDPSENQISFLSVRHITKWHFSEWGPMCRSLIKVSVAGTIANCQINSIHVFCNLCGSSWSISVDVKLFFIQREWPFNHTTFFHMTGDKSWMWKRPDIDYDKRKLDDSCNRHIK
jgi:hypothetical protein